MKRTDTASRVIRATAQEIYNFDAREGGGYRMALVYTGNDPATRGKTTANADVFEGWFIELVPHTRIVERVAFKSADPAFAGAMTITTTLTPVADGTEVRIECENVPPGMSASDHKAGINSTLANLARFTE